MIRGWDPTRDWRQHRLLTTVVLGLLVLVAAASGYLIGSSSEADSSPSPAVSAVAGAQDDPGTPAAGEERARAFKAGRTRGFEAAYPRAYRSAYVKEFRKAGLGAPASVRVPDRGAAAGRGAN